MTSLTPTQPPEPESNPEHETLFRPWFYTDALENSETIITLGSALNTFARSVLKSETLPTVPQIQRTMERLCWNDSEAAKKVLSEGCDCDAWPVISALYATLSRYASEQLSPRFVKGGSEWKANAIGFSKAVADYFNARVAAEKARRVEKAKVEKEGPADLAKLCSKGLPQVAALEAFVSELADAVKRSEGGFGGGSAIRNNFGEPLAKLRRFLEGQITHYEKVEKAEAAAKSAETLPDNTPPQFRAQALAVKKGLRPDAEI